MQIGIGDFSACNALTDPPWANTNRHGGSQTFHTRSPSECPGALQGRHLLRGCTWRDYRVVVEDVEGEVVYVDNDTLGFLPAYNVTPSDNYTAEMYDRWICPQLHPYRVVVSIFA